MDMRNFFNTVKRKGEHIANMAVQQYRDEAKEELDVAMREELLHDIAEARQRMRESDRNRRFEAAAARSDNRSDEQIVQDAIDEIAEDIPDVIIQARVFMKRQKRPVNWEDIADDAQVYGNDAAIANFPDEFIGASVTAKYQRLNQWKKDVKAKKVIFAYHGQHVGPPSYGNEIDLQLLQDCHLTRELGLPIDDVVLRRLLVVRLIAAGKEGDLKENGGPFHYGHSWAVRFYKRHKLASRVCTTKMRELPADFEAKKAVYMKVGAELIYKYNVPPQLVINGDETAVQLVNRAKITRNVVGAKRVKILGMGDDKAQITTTILVSESGDVLPYQMIFTGTTNKCHPKSVKPDDCQWTHTKSHWQSVQTYLQLLEKIIVPYKNKIISDLGLPADQWTILKHDLHFTHKDASVLEYLKANCICPLFVPAGCTDVIQECDVVVNKPFKNAVRGAFRDHLDSLFRLHLTEGRPPTEFCPKLTMGALKPFLTDFVAKGILALKTPEMRTCIQNSFANDGCFALMRSLEMQQNAQIDGTIILQEHPVPEGVEEDEIEEEINAEMGLEAVEE